MGLAPMAVGQVTRMVGNVAEAASESFQALFEGLSPPDQSNGEVNEASTGSVEGGRSNEFGRLYERFQEKLAALLETFPGLGNVRVSVESGGTIRVSSDEASASVSPEQLQQLEAMQTWLNSDHATSELADRVYQAKLDQTWRSGVATSTANREPRVEWRVSAPSIAGSMGG